MTREQQFFLTLTLVTGILGLWGILAVRRAYGQVMSALTRLREEPELEPAHPLLVRVITDYEDALLRRDTQATAGVLVERALRSLRARPAGLPLYAWVRWVRAAISICIVLGVLGTFVGLFLALGGLQGSLAAAAAQAGNADEMAGLLDQLRSLMGGMSTAFFASVCGVGGSLALTFFSAVFGTFSAAETLAEELEHFLVNEYLPKAPSGASEQAQRRLLERFDEAARSLESSIASGLTAAADRMVQVVQLVEPILGSLGNSGQSLAQLSQNMAEVTTDMHAVLSALKASQETVPQRMEELQKVESSLIATLGVLTVAVESGAGANERLTAALASFDTGAQHLESTLSEFRREWPAMMREFTEQTQQAVAHQAINVSEAVERLREMIEQSHVETVEQMEALVSSYGITAQTIAASLNGGTHRASGL